MAATLLSPLPIAVAVESICRLASFEKAAPSTIRAVPATLAAFVPMSRMESRPTCVSEGFSVTLPGSSCITSFRLEGWMCSSVCLLIFEAEVISPPSLAVTTTSSRERLETDSSTFNLLMLPLTSSGITNVS